MDEVDLANRHLEKELSNLIHNARMACTYNEPQQTGYCRYCDEPLDEGFYCDIDCEQDHVREIQIRRRQGNAPTN